MHKMRYYKINFEESAICDRHKIPLSNEIADPFICFYFI